MCLFRAAANVLTMATSDLCGVTFNDDVASVCRTVQDDRDAQFLRFDFEPHFDAGNGERASCVNRSILIAFSLPPYPGGSCGRRYFCACDAPDKSLTKVLNGIIKALANAATSHELMRRHRAAARLISAV
ncbi:hypothetical protein L596_021772 [Steinernema carpocapsae]|uniref:Uncharacterized protein n=1 Tax=Steinernema carpocapsae TaxID=34508 RepID=A0A4U5MJR9_STECR|nr:hypothetical protein L596_021772 [Steinernema carpocapsae]